MRRILDLRCLHCGKQARGLLCDECTSALFRDREPTCDRCGMHLPNGAPRCDGCCRRGRTLRVHALFCDTGIGASLFSAYKHAGCSGILRLVLGCCATEDLAALMDRIAVLVPVPPSAAGMRSRGWDPALTFARAVGRHWALPVQRVLSRKHGAQQKSLGAAERQGALVQMLSVRGVVPGPVLLVDDLSTTGASLESCATVLRQHGIAVLGGLVLARHVPVPLL